MLIKQNGNKIEYWILKGTEVLFKSSEKVIDQTYYADKITRYKNDHLEIKKDKIIYDSIDQPYETFAEFVKLLHDNSQIEIEENRTIEEFFT